MAYSFATEKTAEQKAVMMLPPGLEPPPGLEGLAPKARKNKPQRVAAPPGLEKLAGDDTSMTPMYVASKLCPPPKPAAKPAVPGFQVQLTSLPNHLLSDAMMTATLDQAKLDKFVVSIVTKPGQQRGKAVVTLSNIDAAVACAQHFHGRRWDQSGITVEACLLPVKAPSMPKPAQKTAFQMSAGAAEFVPGNFVNTLPTPAKAALAKASMLDKIGSDVSTEDGESAASSPRAEKETLA